MDVANNKQAACLMNHFHDVLKWEGVGGATVEPRALSKPKAAKSTGLA